MLTVTFCEPLEPVSMLPIPLIVSMLAEPRLPFAVIEPIPPGPPTWKLALSTIPGINLVISSGFRPFTCRFSICLPIMVSDRSALVVCSRGASAETSTVSVSAPISITTSANASFSSAFSGIPGQPLEAHRFEVQIVRARTEARHHEHPLLVGLC